MKIDRLAFAPWFACALLLIAFVIGGASQEALSLHQIFNLGCWVVLLLTSIVLPPRIWSQLPRLPILLFAGFCVWSLIQIVPVSFDGWWFERSRPDFSGTERTGSYLGQCTANIVQRDFRQSQSSWNLCRHFARAGLLLYRAPSA